MPHGRAQLPVAFFESPYLKDLVYLDVSDIPGSLKSSLVQGSMGPENLPNLRILKAQGREMDDSTAIKLFRAFRDQLWSLDLSRNHLTDAVVDHLVAYSFPAYSLRSNAHFEVEGSIEPQPGKGTSFYGPFGFYVTANGVVRSPTLRGISPTPRIYHLFHGTATQEDQFLRSDGRSGRCRTLPARSKERSPVAPAPRLRICTMYNCLETCNGHGGLSHLRLNGNYVSAKSIEKMIRVSGGQLEHF